MQDILAAIPWGILLAFTIGPVFFVLLETSAIKGIRAGIAFDLGVITSDIVFILIAYFSTNQILEKLKDDPALFIFGGVLLLCYGIISFLKIRREYRRSAHNLDDFTIYRKNYAALYMKGFLLNFINIGVLGFWLGIIIVFGPKLDMEPRRIITFFATIIITYLVIDFIKIVLAKQLKGKLTAWRIYRIKRVISIVLMVFGIALVIQGLFPGEKEKIKEAIEDIRNK
ncbi:LysE family translocator [Sinomicrobium soli]|uniref:LysE family translocator n=1 Tax=Sinomicrobium sp. N-1-3-6 TaxID=2219864 RepID=UPI000DCCA036|nr:LysE family transporter [Sinomicrobium sp. N-1-3-6]RAV29356.1 LysE family translocator [Sinomicrobium sp. N-1-3-6]